MSRKVLVTLELDDVAPRFDFAAEAWLGTIGKGPDAVTGTTLVLSSASADAICKLALTEKVDTIVCGAIEDKYYDYLQWKGIEVLDSVAGPLQAVQKALVTQRLKAGSILIPGVPWE